MTLSRFLDHRPAPRILTRAPRSLELQDSKPAGHQTARRHPAPSSSERGSTVIVVFAVISIMVTLLFSNLRTVTTLDQELRLIERRQNQRWMQVSQRPHADQQARTPLSPLP